MGIFLWPSIVAVVLLCAWSAYATMAIMKQTERDEKEFDEPISPAVARHPFLLNPIIMMYLIVGVLMVGIIFYFYATTRY